MKIQHLLHQILNTVNEMFDIRNLLPEIGVTLTHFLWTYGWWYFGHFFYIAFIGCDEEGFTGCSKKDPIGSSAYLLASIMYFFIARHVLNFFYRGELPEGKKFATEFSKIVNANSKGGKKSKRR